MATFKSSLVAGNQPAGTSHGINNKTQLHTTVSVTAAMTTNDVIQFGYLPVGAVVTSATLKAQTQLDSNGSPTLTFDLGIVGTTTLWKSAVSTVGRASGASVDTTVAAGGVLYKNTTGAKVLVEAICHAAAATAVAGVLEVEIGYFVEDAAGSNP